MQSAWLWAVESAVHQLLYHTRAYPPTIFHQHRLSAHLNGQVLCVWRVNSAPIHRYIQQCLRQAIAQQDALILQSTTDECEDYGKRQIRFQRDGWPFTVVFTQQSLLVDDEDETTQSTGADDSTLYSDDSSDSDKEAKHSHHSSDLADFRQQLMRMIKCIAATAVTIGHGADNTTTDWSLECKITTTTTTAEDDLNESSDYCSAGAENNQIIPIWQAHLDSRWMFVVHVEQQLDRIENILY
jgi:hypothetical protein